MATTLNAHASGGLYLQDQFALLIYPSGTADWAFLDPEMQASSKLRLKFILRSPLRQQSQVLPQGLLENQLPTTPMSFPNESKVTSVFRHLFNIDYKTLIPQNAKTSKDLNTFFLMFPPSSADEHELVVKFLEANGAIIYSSHTPGSWHFFTSNIEAGVVIVSVPPHYIEKPTLHLIPNLYRKSGLPFTHQQTLTTN